MTLRRSCRMFQTAIWFWWMVSQDHRFHRKARISLNLNRPLSFVVWALAVSTLCCTWVESKLIRSVGYLAKKPKTKSKVLSDTVFTKNLNCSLLKSEIAFCIKCRYFLMLFVCSAPHIVTGNQKLDSMDFHLIWPWHFSTLYIHARNHLLTFVDVQACYMVLSWLFYSTSGIHHLPRQLWKWYPASVRCGWYHQACDRRGSRHLHWRLGKWAGGGVPGWPGAPLLLPGFKPTPLHSLPVKQ